MQMRSIWAALHVGAAEPSQTDRCFQYQISIHESQQHLHWLHVIPPERGNSDGLTLQLWTAPDGYYMSIKVLISICYGPAWPSLAPPTLCTWVSLSPSLWSRWSGAQVWLVPPDWQRDKRPPLWLLSLPFQRSLPFIFHFAWHPVTRQPLLSTNMPDTTRLIKLITTSLPPGNVGM